MAYTLRFQKQMGFKTLKGPPGFALHRRNLQVHLSIALIFYIFSRDHDSRFKHFYQ